MFVYKAFWAVALLLIAANAVSVAAAQAGGSKREVIGDEYKGLLQSMDHKDSTARRLLKDFGATEGERTKRILDSIEEATGPAGLLMDFSAHDSQIDSIIRVLMEAEHMDMQAMNPPPYGMNPPPYGMYPPPYGMYPPPYGMYPPPYGMHPPSYGALPPPYGMPPPYEMSPPHEMPPPHEVPSPSTLDPPPMYRHSPPSPPPSAPPMPPTPPSPPPMPPSPPNPPPFYRHRPPPYGAVESLSRKLIALVLSLEDDKVALKSDTIEENV